MSISNSNERIPKIPFGRVWLITAISLVACIIVWNWFWFTKNVFPMPKDNEQLWAYHRRRVLSEPQSVVLIGSSRIQTGFNQNKFSELTGKKTIQLAIAGESPLPVLENLADDDTFKSLVIVDFSEIIVYPESVAPDQTKVVRQWIKFYKDDKKSDELEFWLQSNVKYLVSHPDIGNNSADTLYQLFNGSAFSDNNLLEKIRKNRPIFFDRSVKMSLDEIFSKDDAEKLTKEIVNAQNEFFKYLIEKTTPNPEKYLELVNHTENLVQKIQSRGGRVIIVNFPMSGDFKKFNEIAFPRKYFWDVLAQNTSAKTIHYEDYTQLQFEITDGSHLDAKHTAKFTEALVEIIKNDLPK